MRSNGGLFKINETLISFVGNFLQQDKKAIVILDANETIDIEDLQKFYEDTPTRWSKQPMITL